MLKRTRAIITVGLAGLEASWSRAGSRSWSHTQFKAYAKLGSALDRRFVGAVVVNDANGRLFQPGAGRALYAGFTLTCFD